jgi:hypothetical protein
MIVLLVGLSQSGDHRRVKEYDMCLRRNLENSRIDKVILIEEEAGSRSARAWSSNPKVTLVSLNARANYSDFVAIANDHHSGDVCVIANADVYLDWSIRKLEAMPHKTLCAITRTDCFGNLWSSDAWAFRPRMDVHGCEWFLGRLGCETAFCTEVIRQLGWAYWNPCYEVCLTHMHRSRVRTSEFEHRVPYVNPARPVTVAFDGKKFKPM